MVFLVPCLSFGWNFVVSGTFAQDLLWFFPWLDVLWHTYAGQSGRKTLDLNAPPTSGSPARGPEEARSQSRVVGPSLFCVLRLIFPFFVFPPARFLLLDRVAKNSKRGKFLEKTKEKKGNKAFLWWFVANKKASRSRLEETLRNFFLLKTRGFVMNFLTEINR